MYVLHALTEKNTNHGLGCSDFAVLFAGVGVACTNQERVVRGIQI